MWEFASQIKGPVRSPQSSRGSVDISCALNACNAGDPLLVHCRLHHPAVNHLPPTLIVPFYDIKGCCVLTDRTMCAMYRQHGVLRTSYRHHALSLETLPLKARP